MSSFTLTLVSTPENYAPISTTTRPLTVNDISCIMREVVKYLPQLQEQQLTLQPVNTALTYSGDQVCSTLQEVTTTSRANELNPMSMFSESLGPFYGFNQYFCGNPLVPFVRLVPLNWQYSHTSGSHNRVILNAGNLSVVAMQL